jgi:hypothetical protein
LPTFIKSLTVPALTQVGYLKIVVSESDSRYRSIVRFRTIADTFLAQHTFEGHLAEFMGHFSRYIPPHLENAFDDYYIQCHSKFFDKKVGELSGLRHYVLEVQLDLPSNDDINSRRARQEDRLHYGYVNPIWRPPFPELLKNMLKHTGLLDGAKDFEPRIKRAANGNTIFESEIREILGKARRDIKIAK